MKKYYKILLPLVTILLVVAGVVLVSSLNKNSKADIVTTLYPQYDIAKQIAKDKLSVKLMTPLGSEVHSFAPSAKDIVNVKEAKLFIYTSKEMEVWAPNLVDEKVNALELSSSYTLVPYADPNAVVDDLHFWTDPTTILQLITVIRDEIIKVDPANEAFYITNASVYYNKIEATHNQLKEFFEIENQIERSKIYFFGHNAMSSFSNRYNFDIIALSETSKPDAEISPGQKATLKEKIKNANAKYLFVEELIDLKAPNTLVTELKNEGYQIELLELHGFHNISKNQNKEGVSYADLLNNNLENLKKAIN